jgi:hypothetical protein
MAGSGRGRRLEHGDVWDRQTETCGELGLDNDCRQQDTRALTAVNLGRWRPRGSEDTRPEVVGSNPTGPTICRSIHG